MTGWRLCEKTSRMTLLLEPVSDPSKFVTTRLLDKLFRLQQNWFYAHGDRTVNGIAGACEIVVADVD